MNTSMMWTFHNWFDGEILDKIILRDNRLQASRLNIVQLYKEAKINVQKLIKNKKKRLLPRKTKGKCW